MRIVRNEIQGRSPVTVLAPEGALDGASYQELIDAAQAAYQAGSRRVLLDLGAVTYLSSAGLVALHKIALLYSGEPLSQQSDGWEAMHAMERSLSGGGQHNVKLLNPQPRVDSVIRAVGMDAFFEIFTDRDSAIAAF